MTPRELNRDIKRMYKRWKKYKEDCVKMKTDDTEESERLNQEHQAIKKECHRLYHADNKAIGIKGDNVKRLIAVNSSVRAIAPHWFGLFYSDNENL